jgi:hypothetical protein
MHGGRALAVALTTAAILVVPARANAAAEMSCALAGDLTLGVPSVPFSGDVGVTFDGASTSCEGTATDSTVTVHLDGAFGCTDATGGGTATLNWADGTSSSVTAVVATAPAGVAALGTVGTGPYEGDGASLTLTMPAPLAQCTASRSSTTSVPGVLYVDRSLVPEGADLQPPIVDTDPWSQQDQAHDEVDGNITRCAIPGDMYVGDWSVCKYSQAWVGTRCTRTRQVTTSGGESERVCTQKQFTQFAYRGGTSNPRSPKISGRCANSTASPTDTEQWRLVMFELREPSDDHAVYAAAASHTVLHSNCDTEGQRFYGNPMPYTMEHDYRAHYEWAHFPCGYFRPCQIEDRGFLSSLTFGIDVPS